MITKTHFTGLKVHFKLFFYLYDLPLYFNSRKELCVSKRPKGWILFIAFQLLLLQYLCSMYYVVIVDGWLQPNADFTILHKIIYLASSIFLLCIVTIALIVVPRIHKLAHSFNGILSLEQKLCCKSRTNLREENRSLGKLIILLNIFFGCVPWTTVTMLIPIKIDYGYFILQKLLPFSMHQSNLIFFLCIPVRIAILVPLMFEGARLAAFCLSIFVILIESYLKIMQALWKSELSWKIFRMEYLHLFLLHQLTEKMLNAVIYVLLNCIFWIVVTCGSVFIKGIFTKRFEFRMVSFCGFSGTVLFSLLAIIIPKVCYVASSFQRLLAYKRLQISLHIVEISKQIKPNNLNLKDSINACRERKIALLEGKALREVVMKFGTFFVLHRNFAMEYFQLVSIRIFEMTMMSKLW